MRGIKKQDRERRAVKGVCTPAICFAFSVFVLLFFVAPALAQIDTGLAPLTATGLAGTDIRVIIANIIRIFLGLLGVVALTIVLTGGFFWMTAAGNEEKIEKAKKFLTNGAIGLAIILSAYGITAFIFSYLLSGTSGTGVITQDDGGAPGGGRRGALGGGIVESHYPPRNAPPPEIPRNTKILITFKEPMLVSSLVGADGLANVENVKLRKTIAPAANPGVALRATATPDGKTFLFAPTALLGSPSEPISYTMRFEKGLAKAKGDPAFGQFGTFYEWQFEVSTVIDTDPPRVESILPLPSADPYARNVVIQINFTEPIDPTVVVGPTVAPPQEARSKVRIVKSDGVTPIPGKVTVANQYRTIEFVTNDKCGTNSCGGDVFCLPGNETALTVRLPSAKLKDAQQVGSSDFSTDIPYTGIVDLAGNALDGNQRKVKDDNRFIADGAGEPPFVFGSPVDGTKDDYQWAFATNDKIDLTPPVIEVLDPTHNGGSVALDKDIRATFSKSLMSSTFNAATVQLASLVQNVPKLDINYWTATALSPDGKKTIGIIKHDPFAKNTVYTPTITSGVQDGYQNCYSPCAGPGCTGKTWQGYPSCSLP
ncbi:Ig-like domain-containing protein [Candidatus Uhrbacteria bacterium]|nr:Ig-like domain-containing protein [Candidatus Uhrbacteria bacterium]